jgi:glycosyltransferase involved in cell wall biosynthesis
MIKISIIVPVWNVEKYLEKCLDSLVSQTLKEKEIIVINDGSPDNSEQIILKYQKRYPKIIKYIYKENGGQGSARNKGLDIAKGEFISFIDSDDWIEKDMLEKMYNKANEDNSDIVICDMVDHYLNETIYHDCTNFNSPYEKTPSASNKIFKYSLINKMRFLEDKLWYEDMNFTTKLLLTSPKISTISEGLYHCHAHEGSTMLNNNSLKNLDIITCVEDIKDYAIKNNYYDKEIFSFIIFHHILVTSINRVAKQKNKDKKNVIKELTKYCKNNIGEYKKYKYYKNIPINRKIIANLNYYGLSKISILLLNIKAKLK